jgi:hypothetical protein
MLNGKEFSVADLIERHRALDTLLRDRRNSFLSDWNGTHPFVDDFLGPSLSRLTPDALAGEYIYPDERPAITDAIRQFHRTVESLELQASNVLAGAGSSSLLASFALWLAKRKTQHIYYIPPLYHSLHYFLALLNITARPISSTQVFDRTFELKLPKESTVLMFCDPIWFAGKHVPPEVIKAISSWQQRTGSLILVDGSFQYLSWSGKRDEITSTLDPDLTFRLVCPTKALAIHAYRFSYLLHPAVFHDDLTFLYESLVGSIGIGNLLFGLRALEVLSSPRGNRPLADFLSDTFKALVQRGFVRTDIEPDCGYYAFAIPLVPLDNHVVMGQDYFELDGYPTHVRVNLMVARRLQLA